MIQFEIPIKTKGWGNAREHFRVAAKRKMAEKYETIYFAAPYLDRYHGRIPCRVKLTRKHCGRPMDSDNAPMAMKYVRDAISKYMGFDDGDPRCSWDYGQQKAKRADFGIIVEMWFVD